MEEHGEVQHDVEDHLVGLQPEVQLMEHQQDRLVFLRDKRKHKERETVKTQKTLYRRKSVLASTVNLQECDKTPAALQVTVFTTVKISKIQTR